MLRPVLPLWITDFSCEDFCIMLVETMEKRTIERVKMTRQWCEETCLTDNSNWITQIERVLIYDKALP